MPVFFCFEEIAEQDDNILDELVEVAGLVNGIDVTQSIFFCVGGLQYVIDVGDQNRLGFGPLIFKGIE